MTNYRCALCAYRFKRKNTPSSCPNCGKDNWVIAEGESILEEKLIDRPDKQDLRYYKEGWFKRNDKEWKADIKSRQTLPNGQVVRVTEKGGIIR